MPGIGLPNGNLLVPVEADDPDGGPRRAALAPDGGAPAGGRPVNAVRQELDVKGAG